MRSLSRACRTLRSCRVNGSHRIVQEGFEGFKLACFLVISCLNEYYQAT